MPLPSLSIRLRIFQAQIDELLSWNSQLSARRRWIECFNELRFVRATLAWEDFIEQSFVCYLRGSPTISGRTQALAVTVSRNSTSAQTVAIGSRNHYGKWLNETWTLNRASSLFGGSSHPYISLASPTFPEIRKIRNRIVHRSDSSRNEFQMVVTALYGSARPGMTPGRLLTDNINGSQRLETYLALLKAVGALVAS